MKHVVSKLALVTVVALALSSCGPKEVREAAATEYPVLTCELTNVSLQTTYSATIQGRQDIAVYPEVSGKITAVKIIEGQTVKKGQVLFVIDQVPYKAALKSAQANLETAKVALESAQMDYDSDVILNEKGVISDFELSKALISLNSAKASLAQAEANLTTASNNLSYTEVKAPSDGVVGTIPYREGQLVGSSSLLTNVSDNSLMYVYFSLNENAALDLALQYGSMEKAIAGMPDVQLKLNNGTIYEHTGRVASISGVINTSTGSVSVRAEYPNPDRILLSGANGVVVFPDNYDNVIVIPQEATAQLQNKYFVYKIIDGVTQMSEITVLAKNDSRNYIVTSGLEVGDKIVSAGAGLLRSGIKVKVD